MATIKDIAILSQVSPGTVSRVLNNDQEISVADVTRERIFKAAKELGYKTIQERKIEQKYKRQNKIKENKKSTKTELNIGILLCQTLSEEVHDPYFLSIREGVEEELYNQGITSISMFRLNDSSSNKLIRGLDGLIIIGRISKNTLKTVSDQIENIVYINHSPDEDLYDSVVIDFVKSTEYALNHILDCGYKRIGYIGGVEKEHINNQKVIIEDERLTTYERIMKKEGLFNPNYIFIGEYKMSHGYRLMKEALQEKDYPEAFFIASDPMAIGALKGLQEAKLSIPRDIAIVSFDDIEIAKFASTPLTTIRVNTKGMGQTGVKLLLDRIKGRVFPLKVIVPTQLIIRQSTTVFKQNAN